MAPPTGRLQLDLEEKTMEALSKKLDAKLQLLKLTRHKTEGVVDTANVEKIRFHKQALQAIVQGVNNIPHLSFYHHPDEFTSDLPGFGLLSVQPGSSKRRPSISYGFLIWIRVSVSSAWK